MLCKTDAVCAMLRPLALNYARVAEQKLNVLVAAARKQVSNTIFRH
jgi:hypothetical protein